MPARVILNPYSGRWNGRQRWPAAQAALTAAGLVYEVSASEHPGHACELAAQAVRSGCSPIIVAGGDGTLSEVVNGLAQVGNDDHPLGPLGILPVGTANEFFRLAKP